MACLWCGGLVPPRVKATAGHQPGLCSEACRKAHRKAYLKAWWQANRETELVKLAERRKVFKAENPDYFKTHYAKHRERRKQQARAWYRANTVRALAQQQAYDKAHPELLRAIGRKSANKRRAIQAQVFIEVVDPMVVFRRDHGRCGICLEPVLSSRWEIDHIMPISRGGLHCYDNVQLAHRRCNRAKGATFPYPVAV